MQICRQRLATESWTVHRCHCFATLICILPVQILQHSTRQRYYARLDRLRAQMRCCSSSHRMAWMWCGFLGLRCPSWPQFVYCAHSAEVKYVPSELCCLWYRTAVFCACWQLKQNIPQEWSSRSTVLSVRQYSDLLGFVLVRE
jgi:hypothetical protein